MQGTIIRCEKLTLHFGGQTVFEDLSCELYHDARIGLIGPNAAGKSSLLRVLAGELEPSAGNVYRPRGIRVGYLHQEVTFDLQRTLLEEAREASPSLAALEAEMESLERRMGDPLVYNDPRKLGAASHQYEHCLERFQAKGGLNFENRVRSTLRGLGFHDADLSLPLSALSGGQKKLVGLAKLLIEQPELLLLDEPDNHLDFRGKRFLEQWIADYPGAVVIVSHDRYLLDIVAENIMELERGQLAMYTGNYSEFAFEKNRQRLAQEQQFHLQQREIRRMETAIRRLMGWAAGQNEKLVRRGRSMQKRLDKIEKVDKPVSESRAIGLSFSASTRGSNRTLDIRKLEKSFDGKVLFRDMSLEIWNGARVGMIGPNGAGKTVLLKCILGKELPSSGEIAVGPSNTIGYYSQEHQMLNPEASLAEEITRFHPMGNRELFGMLGRFLFSADDASKKIRNLSGGEKARVQMARLMLSGANFLLLDEPTNHLDIRSAETLELALEEFEGTILAVSHDRYFLDNVANRIVELEAGKLTDYNGNYTSYLEAKSKVEAKYWTANKPVACSKKNTGRGSPPEPKKESAASVKHASKKRSK